LDKIWLFFPQKKRLVTLALKNKPRDTAAKMKALLPRLFVEGQFAEHQNVEIIIIRL
jgi:hypothetical protein